MTEPEERRRAEAVAELTEILLASIADDEASANEVLEYLRPGIDVIYVNLSRTEGNVTTSTQVSPYDPARDLAGCESKRKLIELAFEVAAKVDGEWGCCHTSEAIRAGQCEGAGLATAEPFLTALALPYATTA